MRLDGGRESENVEDRRGSGGGGGFGGGGGGGIAVGGIGTVLVVVVCLFLGVDPSVILNGGGGGGYADPQQSQVTEQRRQAPIDQGASRGAQPGAPAQDAGALFVRRVLAQTEDVWTGAFRELGRTYENPRLVLFSSLTQSACGTAQSAMGPFYCPNDRRVYIDLDFMAQLQRQLGAQGDFASAYIIAHEVGHHVQNLLGLLQRAEQSGGGSEASRNAMQVRVELQADCFAGLWAKRAEDSNRILEQGDIEEGLTAAAAVGDDRLQRRSRGTVVPESFTHGTSEQRSRWFRTGLQSGRVESCDTFTTRQL